MGRCTINWNNSKVQQSIEDYVCRRLPTQARLRQIISEHLQQHVSEQALSIYLKRNGYSFPRSLTKRAVSCMPHSSPSQVFVKEQPSPSPAKSISSQELIHQLPPDLFYNPSSLFLASCPSSSMDSQLGLNTLNFVGHQLNQAQFSGSPSQHLFGSNNQSPVPGENLESNDISRYFLAEHEESAGLAQCSSSNNEDFGEARACEDKKPHPKVTSQINWKDPVVQWAISDYFERKIKLQTELRQIIMRRLKRSVSENSLRLHLKKIRNSFKPPETPLKLVAKEQEDTLTTHLNEEQLLATPTNGITSSGTLPLLSSSNNKFTYYLCSPQSSDLPNSAVMTPHPVVSANNYLTGYHHHHNGHPPTMVMKSFPLQLNDNSHPMTFVKLNGDEQNDSVMRFHNEIKEEEKPHIRRRINWSNSKVQSAIQDFHDRKILTQARLRAVVEEALGEVVSEQALSIYLKRKKSREGTMTTKEV